MLSLTVHRPRSSTASSACALDCSNAGESASGEPPAGAGFFAACCLFNAICSLIDNGALGTSGGDSARDRGRLAIGLEADEAGLGKGDAGLLGGALGIEVVRVRGADGALSELADF